MTKNVLGTGGLQLHGSKFDDARAMLQSKRWFAFDLDDTLHNFRAASSAALDVVLSKINTDHGSDIDTMRSHYRAILAEKTSTAFTDGRTSHEYRKERSKAVLVQDHVNYDEAYLNQLADLYRQALSENLCLKPGAMDLLNLLEQMDKMVIIITEGPEDAQNWTIKQLGIQDRVDVVATTNWYGISKVEGLLGKVMETYGISAVDIVCIGDNFDRDIVPAVEAGVHAVHYAEDEDVSLDGTPIRVNSLHEICSLLEDGSNAYAQDHAKRSEGDP